MEYSALEWNVVKLIEDQYKHYIVVVNALTENSKKDSKIVMINIGTKIFSYRQSDLLPVDVIIVV